MVPCLQYQNQSGVPPWSVVCMWQVQVGLGRWRRERSAVERSTLLTSCHFLPHRRVRVGTLEDSHFCPCGDAMAVAEWLAVARGTGCPSATPWDGRKGSHARPCTAASPLAAHLPPESLAPACARAQAAHCAPPLAALAARAKLQHSLQVGGHGGVQYHRDPAVSALAART